ncbi:porin [Actibacterium sp. D379-3]
MKKVLLATTALMASAGFASAEMSITGFAEMGVFGGDFYGSDNDGMQFHNDFTLTFDGSSESDNGLSFGFHIEIEESNGAGAINGNGSSDTSTLAGRRDASGASFDNEAVFISGAFGTLTLGETDGAYDKRLTEVALAGGTIADDETTHAGFNGNGNSDGTEDNQVLRYDYSFGDFGLSVSMEQNNDGGDDPANDDDIFALGVSYDMDLASGVALGFGLGYQFGGDDDFDLIGTSVSADFGNGFQIAVNYSDYDGDDDDVTHYGIGVAYTMDAWTFAANYGDYDRDVAEDSSGYGLLVNYDLGGGAVVQFGYGSSDFDSSEDTESYSLGVAMSF